MYNDGMKRTTIVAPEELLDRLQGIADQESVSLAQVIRQGLELRVEQANRPLSFIGVGQSVDEPFDMARQSGELEYSPISWR